MPLTIQTMTSTMQPNDPHNGSPFSREDFKRSFESVDASSTTTICSGATMQTSESTSELPHLLDASAVEHLWNKGYSVERRLRISCIVTSLNAETGGEGVETCGAGKRGNHNPAL